MQEAPEFAEQPRRIVTVVEAAMVVVLVKASAIVGEVPLDGFVYVPVKVPAPDNPLILTLVSESALSWKVVAEGEAALFASPVVKAGKVMVILPDVGMAATVLKEIVCMAVIGTTTGSPA